MPGQHHSLDDAALMRRITQQDQNALNELYDRFGNAVYSLALRVVQHTGMAEEITQDVFLKVWHQSNSWDAGKGKLSSWLLTITRYAAIDRLRKEQRQPDVTLTPVDEMHNIANAALVEDAQYQDGQLLRILLQQLPGEQAQVIQLAFFHGMTHNQMADQLKLPLGTVKTRVRLGLQKLKTLWAEANPE